MHTPKGNGGCLLDVSLTHYPSVKLNLIIDGCDADCYGGITGLDGHG
jgi:hypothetical protein